MRALLSLLCFVGFIAAWVGALWIANPAKAQPNIAPAQVSGLAILMNAPGTAQTGAPGIPPSQALACLPPLPGGYGGMPYATPGMFYDEPGVAPAVANGGVPSGDTLWWCAETSAGATAWVQIVAAP